MATKKHTVKVPRIKQRNFYAAAAAVRTGAGQHTDEKKESDRQACRQPVDELKEED